MRQTHYWDAIVGDNWPAIAPGQWGALETRLREAVADTGLDGSEYARRDFEERVRASAALQPVKDEMLAHQDNSFALTDAAAAVADLLRDFADLSRHTRNRILDIVDDAARAIAGLGPDSRDDRPRIARIHDIVAAAREEVSAAVSGAVHTIGPSWNKVHAELTALPAPGPAAMPPVDAVAIHSAATHPAEHPDTIIAPAGPEAGTGDESTTLAASGAAGWMPGGPLVAQAISRNHEDLFPADAAPPGVDHPAPFLDTSSAERQSPAHRSGLVGMGPGHAADPAAMPLSSAAGVEPGSSDVPGVRDTSPAADNSEPMLMAFMPQSPAVGATADAKAVRSGGVGEVVSSYARSVDRATADRSDAAELPAETADSGARERGTTVERVREYRPGSGDTGRTGDSGHTGETGGTGSGSLLRSVVGSAMASEAAPVFEVGGQRVDGYLVLARTILGGILAAVETSWYGVGFAVGVLRRPGGGVTAFLTSNEGRGWLPSGLYLPREISVPWRWVGSNHTDWEGISDPARILAEFALARESRSDARLAALVSSEPIDAGMRGRLGDAALEGRVPASAAMPLGAPGPGLVDRLGLVISPGKQARLDRIPAVTIAPRCTDLAWDAHERIAQLGTGAAGTLGAPALRQRVLDALRRGQEVQADWWEELRDIDDLLAATILTKRVDVSRIPLGELRSGRPGGEASALRAMVAQRRGNELTLLLAGIPDRRMLRDAVYAHGQLAAHLGIDVRRTTTVPIGGEKTQ